MAWELPFKKCKHAKDILTVLIFSGLFWHIILIGGLNFCLL